MGEKLYEYTGFIGRLHDLRNQFSEKYQKWKEQHPNGISGSIKGLFSGKDERRGSDELNNGADAYGHIYRRKSRKELMRISAAVMGIEFSYAAETAFVSPTLLKIGVEHKHMTLVWALSPLIGFFLTPVLGSLSDRCPFKFGRRRPFIIMMSVGVFLGLLLVPNGELLGLYFGDTTRQKPLNNTIGAHRTSGIKTDEIFNSTNFESFEDTTSKENHPWGIFFTILGTILLDFDADACQSPARAFLLDVTIADDHARGLSTFTIMAGLGGFLGYAMGGINWDVTSIGEMLGGHVRAVFTLITIIFVICVTYTITSFKEMPLELLELQAEELKLDDQSKENDNILSKSQSSYGTLNDEINEDPGGELDEKKKPKLDRAKSIVPSPDASLLLYLKSIIFMPYCLQILCLTNLFCWMAHVCYSLYFTDFVGEAVFNGLPTAPVDWPERIRYEEGVRFGCWGMSMYSLSCACYSTIIERCIKKYGAKKVYITGLIVYSTGMCLMAITKSKFGVLLFSWTAGVMYSTLFTMPYLLVANYHAKGLFNEESGDGNVQVRGLGTDVAIVSSMVFLAQFLLSICMGTIVSVSKTTTAVVSVASVLAFCGAISATKVMYLDL